MHIGFNACPDPWALNLEYHFGPVLQGGPVNLGQRSGSQWIGIDLFEDFFKRCSQIFFDLRTKLLEVQVWRLRLELLEFTDPLGSEQVRAGGKDLAEFDKGRPENFKEPAQTLGTVKMGDVFCMLPP